MSPITVSIEVSVDPERAFEVFTARIDQWWLRGPKHRFRPPWRGRLRFEPGVGGRLLEEYDDGSAFIVGRIEAWVPGRLLRLSWRLPSFGSHETTEVEVRFEPTAEGTRVSVDHRGWETLRGDHPARHRLAGSDLEYAKARLWGESLAALRAYVARELNTTANGGGST